MGRNYFENPSCNVAFERCIDVLAELIEKYAGKFAMDDIGYDYCVYIGNTPVTIVYTYEKLVTDSKIIIGNVITIKTQG